MSSVFDDGVAAPDVCSISAQSGGTENLDNLAVSERRRARLIFMTVIDESGEMKTTGTAVLFVTGESPSRSVAVKNEVWGIPELILDGHERVWEIPNPA